MNEVTNKKNDQLDIQLEDLQLGEATEAPVEESKEKVAEEKQPF